MKKTISRILLVMLMSMVDAKAFAYDIEVKNSDGKTILYNYINNYTELEVTNPGDGSLAYGGDLVIPEEVTYMNRTRKVTSIGEEAFVNSDLYSVTIPNSVTSIGKRAFSYCNSLKSVLLPNSISLIDEATFSECTALTDITIPNSVTLIKLGAFVNCSALTSITIPNSVTSIEYNAFAGCSSLTTLTLGNSLSSIGEFAFYKCNSLSSVTIPNSVTMIGNNAFYECSALTSLTIGNGVTTIGDNAFYNCSLLTSLTIGNSVTTIGNNAFYNCRGLTSLTIPNSVCVIGESAFQFCYALTSLTIGKSVTEIGQLAFDRIDIPIIISYIENPFDISDNTFSNNTYINSSLYVPIGTINKYKQKEGWKKFSFIEEGSGGGGDTPPATSKCDKPTISYQNGKLSFNCNTDGSICQYTIFDTDINSGSGNEVQLGVTYTISVYATKAGYDNSETATATLCWIDVEPRMEGITNSVANVRANAVLIQSCGSTLIISGADDGTPITIYNINGVQAGTAISQNGMANINTSLPIGSVAVVKIGTKSIKVLVK